MTYGYIAIKCRMENTSEEGCSITVLD